MAHRHRTVRTEEKPYTGPVSGKPNVKAHGWKCMVDHCKCGAVRKTNYNGNHTEVGKWIAGKGTDNG